MTGFNKACDINLTFGLSRKPNAKLLQFTIQMGALQANFIRHPAHVAAFQPDMVLEIDSFELIASLSQRQVKR